MTDLALQNSLSTGVAVGDKIDLGPLFPGLGKDSVVATCLSLKTGAATFRLDYMGVEIDTVKVEQLTTTTSVRLGG